jgi:hypothetical protein
MASGTQVDREPTPNRNSVLRLIAILILLLVSAYTIAVIAGLSKDRRIDGGTLGVIGIGALVATILFRPDLFERVTKLEVAGWKLEIEKRQEKQDRQLNDIELILPLLLPATEQKHLLQLAEGKTAADKGNHDLRTELRRLRTLKLIEMIGDKKVGGMADNLVVDIGQFVKLTDLGQRWVERIREIEAKSAETAETKGAD